MTVDVLVSSPEQLRAVAEGTFTPKRLYIEEAVTWSKESAGLLGIVRDSGTEVFYALPYIMRGQALWGDGTGAAGVLIRNLEEAGYLKETGYKGRIVADHLLYVWNKDALAEVLEFSNEWTMPLELNEKALAALLKESDAEASLIVYGRAPMMVSANCVRLTQGECGGEGFGSERVITTYITDRTKRRLPVACMCRSCYNVIWNAVPASLHGSIKTLKTAFKDARLRLQFTTEDYGETAGVIAFYQALLTGREERFPLPEHTTGRWKKSVE